MNISTLIFNLSKYTILKYVSCFLSYIYVFILPVGLLFWIFLFNTRKIYALSIIAFSALTTFLVSELIKNIVRIQRPITDGLLVSERGFSFPSEHSSVTMAIGIVVYSIDKKIGIALMALSILVGLSRVVLGVHYMVDVIAGWSIGILIGFLFVKFFK